MYVYISDGLVLTPECELPEGTLVVMIPPDDRDYDLAISLFVKKVIPKRTEEAMRSYFKTQIEMWPEPPTH